MKDISDVTVLVADTGLFLPFARRMAEEAKRVIYWSPDQRGYPSLRQASIGDGFQDIERVLDFWPMIRDIDLVCFPDVGQSGLQEYLVSIGKPVWGSRKGDLMELARERFMDKLGEFGLDVPNFEVVVGLENLRVFLKGKTDKFIKVSRWRGDFETFHWRDWTKDSGWLDNQGVIFGPLRSEIRFLVFDKIETELEIGADTYSIDGKCPRVMLTGLEHKDTTYFGAVTQTSEMPEQIQAILEAFSPEMEKDLYRNQWSLEIRVVDDKAYFIDDTCRGGIPSSGSQQLLWKNFGEIVWAGANGYCIDPEPEAAFSIECMITCKPDRDCWVSVDMDPALERNARLSYCGFLNDAFIFPPDEFHHGELGWLVVLGNTPTEALDEAKLLADMLPDGLNANLENLTELLVEMEAARVAGIAITDAPIPDPAEVIAD